MSSRSKIGFALCAALAVAAGCTGPYDAADSAGVAPEIHGNTDPAAPDPDLVGMVGASAQPAGAEDVGATLTLDWNDAIDAASEKVVVPDGFVGFSVEYDTGPYDLLGSVHGPNIKFSNLMKNIRGKGTLRMGGMSQERCSGFGANPTGYFCQYNGAGVDAAGWQVRTAGWLASIGANISGVDRGVANHSGLMGAIGRNFPNGANLLAIDVGNEPEYVDNGINGDEYIRRYNEIKQATSAFYGDYLAGSAGALFGDFSRGQWIGRFKSAVQPRHTTHHTYGANGGNPNDCNVDNLMAPTKMDAIIDKGISAAEPDISAKSGVKNGRLHKLNEANSCFNRGRFGISDRQVGATFAMDLMARAAMTGVRGVYFHHAFAKKCDTYAESCVDTCADLGNIKGTCAAYNPISGGWNGSSYVVSTRPVYYALMAFSALQKCSMKALPKWSAGTSNLSGYAFACPDGSHRTLLIDKDAKFASNVKVYVNDPAIRYAQGGAASGERVWSLRSSDGTTDGAFEGDVPQIGKYGAGVKADADGIVSGEQLEAYAKKSDAGGDYYLVPMKPGHIVVLSF